MNSNLIRLNSFILEAKFGDDPLFYMMGVFHNINQLQMFLKKVVFENQENKKIHIRRRGYI